MCAADCSAKTTKPRQASTISPPHLSSAPDTATYRRSGMPPCKGTRCRTRSMQGRDPCRSRLMQNATMQIALPCRSRPIQIATHADRDSKAYASVASTTTPAPKGRNSLATWRKPSDATQCGTRSHADPDPKAYASVVSTTTPAPKGRNSLAQGVSPGTRPTKSRAPEGDSLCTRP